MIITLTNQNKHSPIHIIKVNLRTKSCLLEDGKRIPLQEIISEFKHPLLISSTVDKKQTHFEFVYDDLSTMYQCALFIYSTLLQVDKPSLCEFKIQPSSKFHRSKVPKLLYISMEKEAAANQCITITNFNKLVSDLSGFPFQFSEDVLIETTLFAKDLPQKINGDILIEANQEIMDILLHPPKPDHSELRLLNAHVGFAVYARRDIEKGELIGFYTGVKKASTPNNTRYMFEYTRDSLHLILDAHDYGNITRFINHAPDKPPSPDYQFLLSNLKSRFERINGIEVVLYEAKQPIKKGEQLLINYGNEFFHPNNLTYFNKHGDSFNSINQKKKPAKLPLNHIKIFAKYGVKGAQLYLLRRAIIILISILLLIGLINYV
ncbi:eukaryotic huntingtin interacting protein B (plasmid) [Legionella adelaidensis]|uniref:Eukaryotic huntingtin interacting protein B n=1 Tax=Legionella adelaidensis TaxID=45056 RepID=A0A0W0R071_9GAMM|nr:SET domain-containing protein-lysine N-methyltransferase [Legionella adelaidensis]KTC64500.1 eukaryotic huntingtin interacting protein B [Legionella adelaidensis]VEH85868.1 eukaryotic huntingtin interacting protein B [Legionella adelaidensis]